MLFTYAHQRYETDMFLLLLQQIRRHQEAFGQKLDEVAAKTEAQEH